MAKNDARTYAKKFRDFMKNRIPVTGCKYDRWVSEIIENPEEYRQCYDRNDDARKHLPRYWFVSKKGFLISVHKNTPQWVAPIFSYRTEFAASNAKGKPKYIATYALVALVWGSYRSEDAKKILKKQGIKGFGRYEMQCGQHLAKVQAHHIEPYIKEASIDNYIANHDPENLQILTVREHKMVHKSQEEKSGFHYLPTFRDVPHDNLIILDMNKSRLLPPEKFVLHEIKKIDLYAREEDFIITDDYMFYAEGQCTFLEKHKDILTLYATNRPPKSVNIFENFVDANFNDSDGIVRVFYKKIS